MENGIHNDEVLSSATLILEWSDSSPYMIIIEEELYGVVWAYLYFHGKIISDVWLYNLVEAPEDFQSQRNQRGTDGPPLNTVQYIMNPQLVPQNPKTEISVIYRDTPDGIFQAEIAVCRIDHKTAPIIFAVLREGEKVGWCRNAKESGPCAKSLSKAIDEEGFYLSQKYS